MQVRRLLRCWVVWVCSGVALALVCSNSSLGLKMAHSQTIRPDAGEATAIGIWNTPQLARILSLGPWPESRGTQALVNSKSINPLSGVTDAITLGELLFFESKLSANQEISCASCHRPQDAYTDQKVVAMGLTQTHRNTQPLMDLAKQRWFGWDGGADSLWAASIRPMLDAREMGSSAERVAQVLGQNQRYKELARKLQRHPAWRAYNIPGRVSEPEASLVLTAMAIASWLETIESERSAFDRYRDALKTLSETTSNRQGAATPQVDSSSLKRSDFTRSAERGLETFIGKGNCWICHGGPQFTHGEFHDTGIGFLIPAATLENLGQSKSPAAPQVDPGRYRGIERLRNDRYNLTGPLSPDPKSAKAELTAQVVLQHRNWGEWKIPSLRNLRYTAPYMHNGSLSTLREVVLHYSELNQERLHADGEALLKPLRLSPQEVSDLVAFLESLSSPRISSPASSSQVGPTRP